MFEGDWIALNLQAMFLHHFSTWLIDYDRCHPSSAAQCGPDAKTEAEQATYVDEIERLCMGIFHIDFSSIWCQLITESHSLH